MSILKYCPSLNKLKIRNITLDYDQLSLVNSQLHEDQFTKIQRSLTHLDINSDKIPFEDDDEYENDIMELEVLCEFITLFKELQFLNFNSFFEPILDFMRRSSELNLDDSFTDLSVVINFENFLENLNGIGLNFIECKNYNLYRLAQMAPNIKELKIKTLGQISLLVIEKFECLKELSVEPLCSFNDELPTIIADFQSLIPALTQRGPNITHLTLMNVDDIDLNKVAALCPNLIHLELDLNGYPTPVKLLKISKKRKRENFTKLRKLHLKSSGVDLLNYLFFALKSALQLTTLQIESNHGNDVDEYLSTILKYNPLTNLEYFRLISGSSVIDSYEIRKLFSTPEQFPHLRYFNIKFIDPCLECGRTHEVGEPEHCECPFNGYDENCPNHIYLDPEVHRVQL
ncbi:uncharacterized protein LOC128386988 isoform X2 [Panonychus citri]|nr:uncharacterized protein LOC128386988 isoform X2 [Panonychus citri]